MGLNDSDLSFLKSAKEKILSSVNSEHAHTYGFWGKLENPNGTITYSRMCEKCGYLKKYLQHEINPDIEGEIFKQNEAEWLVDYFVNTEDKDLTDDNILFYFINTLEYHSYMDMNKISNKLAACGKLYEIHEEYVENLIYNATLSLMRLKEIPEDIYIDMVNYYNRDSEYLGSEIGNIRGGR